MKITSTDGRAPRRRTLQQLQRKRALDRAGQQRKRREDKVKRAEIQLCLGSMCEAVQNLGKLVQDMATALGHDRLHHIPIDMCSGSYTSSSTASLSRDTSSRDLKSAWECFGSETPRVSSKPCVQTPLECLCSPRRHAWYWECFEYQVYERLMERHSHPASVPDVKPIPLRPALCDLLLLGCGDNEVTAILNKVFKIVNSLPLATLMGIYIHAYRLLRYRFFPSLATLQDIPDWLRPTNIQDCTPHPIYQDVIPFPRLRNAMVQGTVNFNRLEFDYHYMESISVNWPNSKELLTKSTNGATVLHPDFEAHVLDIENWSLGPDFALRYPEVEPLVNIRYV